MLVKELIGKLSKMNPDAVCIHSRDEEGNSYIQGLTIDERLISETDAKSSYLDYDSVRAEDFLGYPDEYKYEDFTILCVVFYPYKNNGPVG